MTELTRALADAAVLLALAALVGLLARGRWRLCRFFTAYLVAVVAVNRLMIWWPARFYSLSFWAVTETLCDGLKLGIAVELGARLFQGLPGARPLLRLALLVVLLVTLLGLVSAPVGDLRQVMGVIHPRLLLGTAWLFVAIAGLAYRYRVPMHPLHRAIQLGFVPYLTLLALLLAGLDRFGWQMRAAASYADQIGYCAVMLLWAVSAWRLEPPVPARPVTVRLLQPWRA